MPDDKKSKRKLTPFRRKYLRFNVSEKRRLVKKAAVQYKGGCCQICGYAKCMAALVFHHINPDEKDFGISTKGISWKDLERIKPELDKCLLLCENCHRELHTKKDEEQRLIKLKEIQDERRALNTSIFVQCLNCFKSFKKFASQIRERNFCSRKCRDTVLNDQGYPDDSKLLELAKTFSIKEIAIKLNKSNNSVYKRLKKIKDKIK